MKKILQIVTFAILSLLIASLISALIYDMKRSNGISDRYIITNNTSDSDRDPDSKPDSVTEYYSAAVFSRTPM